MMFAKLAEGLPKKLGKVADVSKDDPNYARFGDVVFDQRLMQGWSQSEVAARGGPSDTTQSLIEGGTWRSARPARTLAKVDQAFGWPTGTAARVLYEDLRLQDVGIDVDNDFETTAQGSAAGLTSHNASAIGYPGDEAAALSRLEARVERLTRDLNAVDDRIARLTNDRAFIALQLRDAVRDRNAAAHQPRITRLETAEEYLAGQVTYEDAAARDIGKPSRGQQKRAAADLAGEPTTDDADDMEPR